jgi:hypothetical protein
MGNSQSHVNIPLPNYNENEYQKLKTIIGDAQQTNMNEFIPVSTELIKDQLPYFSDRFKLTFFNLAKEEEKLLNLKYKNIKKSKKKSP